MEEGKNILDTNLSEDKVGLIHGEIPSNHHISKVIWSNQSIQLNASDLLIHSECQQRIWAMQKVTSKLWHPVIWTNQQGALKVYCAILIQPSCMLPTFLININFCSRYRIVPNIIHLNYTWLPGIPNMKCLSESHLSEFI